MTHVCVIPGRYTRDILEASHYPGLEAPPSSGTVIEICTDGVTLDLSGVALDGERNGGVGNWVHDCRDVTIGNGIVIGFHYGIRAENVSNLSIRACVVSDNTNPLDAGWLPDIETPVEEGFGGGIYLRRVRHSVIENNQTGNNFNGIRLWSDPTRETSGTGEDTRRRYTISGNRIAASRESGIYVTDDHDAVLDENVYESNACYYRRQGL